VPSTIIQPPSGCRTQVVEKLPSVAAVAGAMRAVYPVMSSCGLEGR
jgi:hypothetical protein